MGKKKIPFGWSAFDFKSWLANFNIDDALTIKRVENYGSVLNVFVPPLLTSSSIFLQILHIFLTSTN